ncbi:hypothetical protein cyc_07717 [Cyclospora cayetanensis]|uniref:Uncharacterized protein n=1 Tax=Cyclospora cayetanensis TaxID=88456 RepID=A0A1D3DB34_9EIME|nr:hypothetical protein cyc_07717 [Cyclospora cayetanensis]
MAESASSCRGPPGAPYASSCNPVAFSSVKSHGTVWRANLTKAAAFCTTVASATLSRDGRQLALCDGSTLLTLDVAAAANSEAAAPYRGSLASPVGLLRVSECPAAAVSPPKSSPTEAHGEGLVRGPSQVQQTVRQMLTATHTLDQNRRVHCICWLPPFPISEFTQPALRGPSGISRRCIAGLRGDACRCLAVTTRDGSVSLWLHKEKELPLPQALTLAVDLGAAWRQYNSVETSHQRLLAGPLVHSWHCVLSTAQQGSNGGHHCVLNPFRVSLSSCGAAAGLEDPLVAAPAVALCCPCPRNRPQQKDAAGRQPDVSRISNSAAASSRGTDTLTGYGVFSGSLVAVASRSFIALFLVSGSRMSHSTCESSPAVDSTSNTNTLSGLRKGKMGPSPPGDPCEPAPSRLKYQYPAAPKRSLSISKALEKQEDDVGLGRRPRRAATTRARAAVSAALSAEQCSDAEATAQQPVGSQRGGRGRNHAARSGVRTSFSHDTGPPSSVTDNGEAPVVESPRGRVRGAAVSGEGKGPRQGGTRKGTLRRKKRQKETSGSSASSPSFVGSDPPSSSSSSASLTESSSVEIGDSDSGEDADSKAPPRKRKQETQSVQVSRKRAVAAAAAAAAAAESSGGASSKLTAEAEQRQQRWRRAAGAAVQVGDLERASATAGLLQPLLLTVLAIPRPDSARSNDSDSTSHDCEWASPSPPLLGVITDLAVSRIHVRRVHVAGATQVPSGSLRQTEISECFTGEAPNLSNDATEQSSSSEGTATCCSCQVFAALSSGAMWSFGCAFELWATQRETLSPTAVGGHSDTEFVIGAVTAAEPQLLFPSVGIPSGFLQLADISDALLSVEDTGHISSAAAPADRGQASVMPSSLLPIHQQGQDDALLSSWQVAAAICGSRLRVALIRRSAAPAAGNGSDGRSSTLTPHPVVARAEASVFALGFQRGLEGPIVGLSILPQVPLDLAAAAAQQVPALRREGRSFLLLLAALQKGGLLPFVLYPDCGAETLGSSNSSSCSASIKSIGKGAPWVLQPLSPLTSPHRTGRIEDLLMPRAAYSFRPLAPNASSPDILLAALATAKATSAVIPPSAGGEAATPRRCEQQPQSNGFSALETQHQQQQRQWQQLETRKDNWAEDGDPSSTLCPPSVRARRVHNLLSRRLLALMPSQCGALLFLVVQQNDVHLQLAVAPLTVSPAVVALHSLKTHLLELLETAGAVGLSQPERGASEPLCAFRKGKELNEDSSAVASAASVARCCVDAQGLWALHLALRGPFQRPPNPGRPASRASGEKGGPGSETPSKRRSGKETLPREWLSDEEELSAASDEKDPTLGAAHVERISGLPSSSGILGSPGAPSGSAKELSSHSAAATAVSLRELFWNKHAESSHIVRPEGFSGTPAAVRSVLRQVETSGAEAPTDLSGVAEGGPGSQVCLREFCCKWHVAAIRRRRLELQSLSMWLSRLFAALRDGPLGRQAILLLLQHLRAVSACLMPPHSFSASASLLRKAPPSPQRLASLVLSQAPVVEAELPERFSREEPLNGSSCDFEEATAPGQASWRCVSSPPQVITVQDANVQEFLSDAAWWVSPQGVAAAAARKHGEAVLPACPLCNEEGCKSSDSFRCYVCLAYGHRFPACAQCLRCLFTGGKGCAGSPLPHIARSSALAAGGGRAASKLTESGATGHNLSFFYCLLCGAFVCGGELPEPGASQGCGWAPEDAACARSGRCCPLCRGVLRLASVAECCSRVCQ